MGKRVALIAVDHGGSISQTDPKDLLGRFAVIQIELDDE